MTTYIPTATELEELGFHKSAYYSKGIPGGTIYYSDYVPGVREKASFSIYFYGSQMGAKEFYPRSLSDLQTLVKIFNPNP